MAEIPEFGRGLFAFCLTMRTKRLFRSFWPYITAARSRGLGLGATLLRHGLRNGILPVITLLALWLAGLLGGSVVLEVIFAIPGMGRLMFEAVVDKDLPLLQAGLICIVGLAVVINTVTDLLYLAINPVMRSGHAGR